MVLSMMSAVFSKRDRASVRRSCGGAVEKRKGKRRKKLSGQAPEHVIIVVRPLAGLARAGRALEHKLLLSATRPKRAGTGSSMRASLDTCAPYSAGRPSVHVPSSLSSKFIITLSNASGILVLKAHLGSGRRSHCQTRSCRHHRYYSGDNQPHCRPSLQATLHLPTIPHP
jgi:hypothetical protein